MMQTLNAAEWLHYIPQLGEDGKAESRSILLDLANAGSVELEVLSATGVVVNLITADGETLFVAQGSHVNVKLKVTGFSGLEIIATGLLSYRSKSKLRWYERPDPTPLAIVGDQSGNQAKIDLIREEVARYMQRQQISEELRSEISVEELIDDLRNGDLEFEHEVDEFGLSALDMQPVEPLDDDPGSEPPQEQNPPPGGSAPPEGTPSA